MSQEKKNYLSFSNETPNDQGFITPNEAVDFSRYKYNPVILRNHDWQSVSIGLMTDIHFDKDDQSWKGLPDFHGLNDESKLAKAMYEAGYLRSASIGGDMILKVTGETKFITDPKTGQSREVPVLWTDENGFKRAEKFYVYEISVPSLPSNYMAVTDEALEKGEKEVIRMGVQEAQNQNKVMIFEETDRENVFSTMMTLSRNINQSKSTEMAEETKKAKKEEAKKPEEEVKLTSEEIETPKADEDKSNHVVLGADKKGVLKSVIEMLGTLFKDPDPDDKPQTSESPEKGDLVDLPIEEGKMSADEEKLCKESAKKEDNKEEEKEGKEEKAEKEASKKEPEKKEPEEKESEETKEKAKESTGTKEPAKMSAKPIRQTMEEVEKLGLAPAPEHQIKLSAKEGVTFTKLRADKDGEKILGKMFSGTKSNEKEITDYAIILNSILADPKYREVAKQCRFMMSASEGVMKAQRQQLNANPNDRGAGIAIKEIAARLSAGHTLGYETAGGGLTKKTTLTTDGVFSSLDTAAVEWLTLILYKLFPSEDWKNEIPVFGAEQTGRNLGVIWTNIAADPTIYRGTSPAPAADYSYGDTSVGMKLTPYWLQPMIWKPLTMHQLRYDQMASGWVQALAKLNAQIGDDLLYTLVYGLYSNKPTMIVSSAGWPGAGASASQTFNIPNSGSKFIFNGSFSGDLVKPGFNDLLAIEEQFQLQNFDLPSERIVLVTDPTMNRYIKSDPETKSMLTRWINDQGADLTKISHTILHERSRVAAYDPASSTVLDTHGSGVVIPATTLSAGLAFVASQVGLGLGLIDVFMIQDPSNYGYRMSLDMRINARALRSDYTGLCMYTFGAGTV